MQEQRKRIRESRSMRWIDAQVRSEHREINAVISNISTAGCCIRSKARLDVGDLVEIVVPRLGSMTAHIRWRRGKKSGAEFVPGSDRWLVPDPELLAMEIAAAIHASPCAG
jgi:hypothetical protein